MYILISRVQENNLFGTLDTKDNIVEFLDLDSFRQIVTQFEYCTEDSYKVVPLYIADVDKIPVLNGMREGSICRDINADNNGVESVTFISEVEINDEPKICTYAMRYLGKVEEGQTLTMNAPIYDLESGEEIAADSWEAEINDSGYLFVLSNGLCTIYDEEQAKRLFGEYINFDAGVDFTES